MVHTARGIDAFSKPHTDRSSEAGHTPALHFKEKPMFAANTHKLRIATESDADALRRLAELDSRRPLAGRVLIAEIAGSPAAALSLDDDRVIADPFRRTDHLVACLRIRAGAIRAHEATPSLSERMRAALRPRAESDATGSSVPGVRMSGSHPLEIQETPTPSRFLGTPLPRLRWTHLPAGTGLTARWAPAR
jgi:hypothetical protein